MNEQFIVIETQILYSVRVDLEPPYDSSTSHEEVFVTKMRQDEWYNQSGQSNGRIQ